MENENQNQSTEQQEGEQKGTEKELEERAKALDEREKALDEKAKDLENVTATLRKEYDEKVEKIKADYEVRLKNRDEVIEQLAKGEDEQPQPSFMDVLNAHRKEQIKKW